MSRVASQPPEAPVQPVDQPPADRDDLRTFVTISRRHRNDVQQRQVVATIDHGRSVTLMFGQAVTHEVTPGAHLLRVHNTLFWKKVPFTVEPGEHLEFIVINRAGRVTFGFLAGLGLAPLYLTIERRSLI